MSQRDQMPRDRFRGTEIIRLDVDKLLAKGSPLAQQDGGNALFEEILKNPQQFVAKSLREKALKKELEDTGKNGG